MKYVENEEQGIFKFDFIQKLFFSAFYWKTLLHDRASKELIIERRKLLKAEDVNGYKSIQKKIIALEEKLFEFALKKVKEASQIIPVNFQNSLDVHLKDPEKKKKLALLEEKAKAYQRNIKLNNIKTQSNITKI